jgi:hypothetical protein
LYISHSDLEWFNSFTGWAGVSSLASTGILKFMARAGSSSAKSFLGPVGVVATVLDGIAAATFLASELCDKGDGIKISVIVFCDIPIPYWVSSQ